LKIEIVLRYIFYILFLLIILFNAHAKLMSPTRVATLTLTDNMSLNWSTHMKFMSPACVRYSRVRAIWISYEEASAWFCAIILW